MFIVGITSFLIYAIILLLGPILTLNIDKNKNSIYIEKGNFWTIDKTELPLADIQSLTVEEQQMHPFLTFMLNQSQKDSSPKDIPANVFGSKQRAQQIHSLINEDSVKKNKAINYRFVFVLHSDKTIKLTRFFNYKYLIVQKNLDAINKFLHEEI